MITIGNRTINFFSKNEVKDLPPYEVVDIFKRIHFQNEANKNDFYKGFIANNKKYILKNYAILRPLIGSYVKLTNLFYAHISKHPIRLITAIELLKFSKVDPLQLSKLAMAILEYQPELIKDHLYTFKNIESRSSLGKNLALAVTSNKVNSFLDLLSECPLESVYKSGLIENKLDYLKEQICKFIKLENKNVITIIFDHIIKFKNSSLSSILSIFGQQPDQQFIVARIFLELRPVVLINEFHLFNLLSKKLERSLFNILKRKKPHEVALNIIKFPFLYQADSYERFLVAEELAQEAPGSLLISLPNFQLSSQHNAEILENLIAKCHHLDILYSFKKVDLHPADTLHLLCLLLEKDAKHFNTIERIFPDLKSQNFNLLIEASLKSPNSYLLLEKSTCRSLHHWLQANPRSHLLIDFQEFIHDVNSISITDLSHLEEILCIATLKHPSLPTILLFEISYNTFSKLTETLCKILLIKLGAISSSPQKIETAWQAAKNDFYLLLENLPLFELEDPQAFYKFIGQLARKRPEIFCRHFSSFSHRFSEEENFKLVKQAAGNHGLSVSNLLMRAFQADKKKIFSIAKIAIKQNKQAFDILADSEIDLSSIVEQRISKLHEKLSDRDDVSLLKFLNDCSVRMLEAILTNDKVHSMLAGSAYHTYWHCKLVAKAAELFQQSNMKAEALSWRLKLSSISLLTADNPLREFDSKLISPKILSSSFYQINMGSAWSHVGSNQLKGGYFHVKHATIKGEKRLCVHFKVTYLTANDIRAALSLLEIPAHCKQAEALLQTKITIDEESEFFYFPTEDGYLNVPTNSFFLAGKAITIDFENIGQIQIGNDKQWGSLINSVHIYLKQNGSITDLQKLLSVMGMVHCLIPSTPEDILKLKINKLIQFYYPQIATTFDNEPFYYELPGRKLLNEIEYRKAKPKFSKKVLEKIPKLQFVTSVGGEEILYMPGLSVDAEKYGARALYAGMNSKADLRTAIQNLACIKKIGMLSTQARFEAGLLIEGSSSKDDFLCNSADSIFFRVITQKAIDQQAFLSTKDNLGGFMQIIVKTEVFNLLGYGTLADCFGCRNRESNFPGLSNQHANRPKFINYIKELQRNWRPLNEYMIKNYLDPKYIAGITYQDPRKVLAQNLDFILPGFFHDSSNLNEKAEYISQNPERVKRTLKVMQMLDTDQETYQGHKLEDHWFLDPKEEILKALEREQCDLNDFFIVETNSMSNSLFETCHSSSKRSAELEQKCLKLAGMMRAEQLGLHLRRRADSLIDSLRIFFAHLDESQLEPYYSALGVIDALTNLKKLCQKNLNDVIFSGRNSLNRQLLTSSWNVHLRNPKIILAIFALEALRLKAIKDSPLDLPTLVNFIQFNTNIGKMQTISNAIYYGFKSHHPILLEKLPNNLKDRSALKELFLEEYLRRQNIEETFLPIWDAIESACQEVLGTELQTAAPQPSILDNAYDPAKWQDVYQCMFDNILEKISSIPENSLLSLAAKEFTPKQLKKQSLQAMHALLKLEGLKTVNLSIEGVLNAIKRSIYLLDPQISHLFYDRLHILAALKCDHYLVHTLEGHIPYGELFIRLIQSFKHGVKPEEGIAAEQFYIRLADIYTEITSKSGF